MYLLDTKVLLWSLGQRDRLNQTCLDILTDESSKIYLSAASTWEIAIKYQLGKVRLPSAPDEFISDAISSLNLVKLDVNHRHATAVWRLPLHHRDPFDRLLIAQAQLEGLAIITADQAFTKYGIKVLLSGIR